MKDEKDVSEYFSIDSYGNLTCGVRRKEAKDLRRRRLQQARQRASSLLRKLKKNQRPSTLLALSAYYAAIGYASIISECIETAGLASFAPFAAQTYAFAHMLGLYFPDADWKNATREEITLAFLFASESMRDEERALCKSRN